MTWARYSQRVKMDTVPPNCASLSFAALLRQTPEVGAECVSSARPDLCGGVAGNGYSYRDHNHSQNTQAHTPKETFTGPHARFTLYVKKWSSDYLNSSLMACRTINLAAQLVKLMIPSFSKPKVSFRIVIASVPYKTEINIIILCIVSSLS